MNKIKFLLNGCDICFVAKAPKDITLEQLLKQCNRIKPDYCACGITDINIDDYGKVEIDIDYEDIKKVDENAPCEILKGESNE